MIFFFISINCPLLWIKFSWKHSFYCKMHEFSFKYIWYLSISFIVLALGIYAYCMEKVHFFSWCSVERHLEAPLRILRIFSRPKWIWIFIEFNLYFHTFLSINQTNNSLISSFFLIPCNAFCIFFWWFCISKIWAPGEKKNDVILLRKIWNGLLIGF